MTMFVIWVCLAVSCWTLSWYWNTIVFLVLAALSLVSNLEDHN